MKKITHKAIKLLEDSFDKIFKKHSNKEVDAEQLVDELNDNYYYDMMIDDAYWNDENFASIAYDDLEQQAKKFKIKLINDSKIEDYFYDLYKNAEKGLS